MSALRCRPGDLAIVVEVKRTVEAIGLFVVVERLIAPGETVSGYTMGDFSGAAWVVRSAVDGGKLPWRLRSGGLVHVNEAACGDWSLRPIRPDAGEDEMLLLVGLPNASELA